MTDFKYVVDSSTIIRRSIGDTYDMQSFPHHWKNFDEKVEEGLIVSTPSVYDEINAKRKELLNWAEENDSMFDVRMDQAFSEAGTFLSKKFPLWYFSHKDDDTPWADPEIIAFALAHDAIVVTQEHWDKNVQEQNYKIPTVCAKLGAYCQIQTECTSNIDINIPFQCIDFVELAKREKLFQ